MIYHKNIPLASKNWFQTGGPARLYVEPQSEHDVSQALLFARDNDVPVVLLGEGANVLISDEGINGLVIRLGLRDCSIDSRSARVTAGAGVSMGTLIDYCLHNGLLGLEEFSGIPGTVGGALYINLHYFSYLIEQFLFRARVIHKKSGEIRDVDASWFNFGYNSSTLQSDEYYLTSATFQLRQGSLLDCMYARGRRDEIIRHRQRRYPRERTCGSFFRNLLPHEIDQVPGNIPYVAYYLDKAGVRGQLVYGGASVSHLHANMIVTQQGASSRDVMVVAQQMQQRVFDLFGLRLYPECRLLGFGNRENVVF